ncbi:hypothetical protein Y032_0338g2926 [Ancylostoma ceylanicum]|nr:hypothetical protein Y032_0338g2926 [Ancylostoma ceylanicum]
MLCMFMVVQLMFDMFGCRRALARYLKKNGIMIKLSVPPYASCCTCAPDIKPRLFFTISNFVNIVSMYFSLYFVYVLFEVAKKRLEPYRFGLLFKIHDTILSVPAHQKLILDLLVALDLIGNVNNLPASNVAMFYLNFLLIWEFLIVSLYSTYAFQPDKTLLFDEFYRRKQRDNDDPPTLKIVSTQQEEFLNSYSDSR